MDDKITSKERLQFSKKSFIYDCISVVIVSVLVYYCLILLTN